MSHQHDQPQDPRAPFEVYAWSSHEIRARQPWYSDQSESLTNMTRLAEQMRDSGRWLAVRVYADGGRAPIWSWTTPGRHVKIAWSKTETFSHTFALADYIDAGEEDGLEELLSGSEGNESGAFIACTERDITGASLVRNGTSR
jgi:hypothetical protein